jgi:hypothetical protein
MKTSFSGTILNGNVQLDERVELADKSRVHVTIIPVDEWRKGWNQALAALDRLKVTNPIRSGGLKFTRDQLHERG